MLQNTLSLADKFSEFIGKANEWINNYIEYLKGVEWVQVATVVIAGICIVLGVLIVLIFVFNGFGKLVSSMEASAKKRAAKKAAKKAAKEAAKKAEQASESAQPAAPVVKAAPPVAKAPVAPAPVVEEGISGEVVAAITAAIAAQEGNNQFVIRSVKKKDVGSRNPWARAAVTDNTRAF